MDSIEELDKQPEIMCRSGSAIISALGVVLAGPLYNEEGILYADLGLAEVGRGKFHFNVVGHYARPDVFQLVVNLTTPRKNRRSVTRKYLPFCRLAILTPCRLN